MTASIVVNTYFPLSISLKKCSIGVMKNFNYGFILTYDTHEDQHCLTFLDMPKLSLKGKTRDDIFQHAQAVLDDYLYDLLKQGKKIPLPKSPAPKDKILAPSEAIQEALAYYLHDA